MTALLLVFLPLAVAYAGTGVWIWDSWRYPDWYWSHGPLVVALAAVLVWARRDQLRSRPARVDPRGWWLLGPGLCLHLIGAALTIDSLSAMSLLLALPGAALLACGPARFLVLGPVLGLLPFVVPLPMFATGRLAFELKEVAVEAGLWLATSVGFGAERVGSTIHVPGQEQSLLVADPCSGLRSLIALATLGYCFAFFLGEQRGPRRWVLLASAAPIAVGSNVVRIAILCGMAEIWSVDFASGTGHDIVSYAVWGVALALLLGVDLLIGRWQGRRGTSS